MTKAPAMGNCPELECRTEDMKVLANRAHSLRRGRKTKRNPYYPAIPCASCKTIAIEGFHFCSKTCKLEYDRMH